MRPASGVKTVQPHSSNIPPTTQWAPRPQLRGRLGCASVAESADAPGLGPGTERCGSSSLPARTTNTQVTFRRARSQQGLRSRIGQTMSSTPARLKRPRAAVKALLEGRISLGKELRTEAEEHLGFTSPTSADDVAAAFKRWDRYNEVLLKQLIDGDDVHKRYGRSTASTRVVTSDQDRISNTIKKVRGATAELEAVVEILELLPEDSSSEPTPSPPAAVPISSTPAETRRVPRRAM